MLKRFLFALIFFAIPAHAQVGSTASTCIWSGTLADCLPSTGILLRNQRVVRFSEAVGNGTNYVALTAPAALAADRTATFPDATGNVVIDSATQTLTNKTIDSSSNTISNIVDANISASAAIAGSKLVAATASVAGAVSIAAQSFAGLKVSTGGLVNTVTRDVTDGDVTLTTCGPTVFTGFTAAHTVTLPTTGILAGQLCYIENTSSLDLTIQSSGSNTIDVINAGYIWIRVVNNTPTAAADWKVVEVSESFTKALTNMSGAWSGGSFNVVFSRSNKITTIRFPSITGTSGSLAALTSSTFVPSRLRPAVDVFFPVFVRDGGTAQATCGQLEVASSGTVIIGKTYSVAAFTATGTAGLDSGIGVSYVIP